MHAIKTYGKVQAELAREFAEKVGQSVTFDGSVIRFDGEDAGDLVEMAKAADRYWMSVRKPSMAKAACALMKKFSEIKAMELYALRFAR